MIGLIFGEKPRGAWQKWVDKRSPSASRHRLFHKNLYVLPTRTGWAFLFLAFIIWLLGTNYQNNLILALAYFQVSLLVVVILNTYNNLSGMELECLGSDSGQVGQVILFKFRISTPNTFGCHYVKMIWQEREPVAFDFVSGQSEIIEIPLLALKRGRVRSPRLLIKSDFPMGLVKCWTWLRFGSEAIVYPKPLQCELPLARGDGWEEGENKQHNRGGEEFLGYQLYRSGDSLRHIAWKQYARERGLYSKLYSSNKAKSEALNWEDFFKGDVEQALSQMTYWAQTLHSQNSRFSMLLPESTIPLGDGEAHFNLALKALALHGCG